MDRTRILRYVRITVSVSCLIVCGLLIVMWVRSYWWRDSICGWYPPYVAYTQVTSQHGSIVLVYDPGNDVGVIPDWVGSIMPAGKKPQSPIGVPHFSLLGFHAHTFGQRMRVAVVPYWFPTLFIASLGAILVIRRPYRFSLRTLLIGMTIIAVVCGAIAAVT